MRKTRASKRDWSAERLHFDANHLIRINMVPPKAPYSFAQRRAAMIGITLTTDQIRSAPKEVRQWIEREVVAALGLAAAAPAPPVSEPAQTAHLVACSMQEAAAVLSQIQGMWPAVNVFFEFARPTISFGEPPVMTFRLIDILHHTKLQSIEQIMECLEAINQALARVRHDASAKFCGFDSEGHCFVAPQTQASIAQLWQSVIAAHQGAARDEAA
jgi:hypothetical protein